MYNAISKLEVCSSEIKVSKSINGIVALLAESVLTQNSTKGQIFQSSCLNEPDPRAATLSLIYFFCDIY